MSLRLRLIIAFLVPVFLVLMVGVTAFVLSRRIETDVADLRSSQGIDLRSLDLQRVGVEFEGFWDGAGSFVANDVEVLAGPRQPKLRGPVQDVDVRGGTLVMYGVTIEAQASTEVDGQAAGAAALERLRAGQRIEVSCSVIDERWSARKLRTRQVKDSDKIKGTVTLAELDGVAPEAVEIHGLSITLAPVRDDAPRSALNRIKLATRMALALRECVALAHELADRPPGGGERREAADLGNGETESLGLRERLALAEQAFMHYLSRTQAREGEGGRLITDGFAHRLAPVVALRQTFADQLRSLRQLVDDGAERAGSALSQTVSQLVDDELLPPINAYLSEAEEALGDQLRSASSRTATAARIVLVASTVAVVLALVLALLVWRSVHRPIRSLHDAALQLGQGHLDTRVGLDRGDELGVLASAFDRMAAELARTTVSVREKEVLLRDVHHRVKNNMQVISSLLAMQMSSSGDAQARALFEQSHNRIRSMALIHEQLYQGPDLARIDLRSYLGALTVQLSQSLGMSDSVRTELEVDDVRLDLDQCLTLGLIVNELVTNAYKHAFPGGRTGRILISLRATDRSMKYDCMLRVDDDGCGLPDELDLGASRTLGMQLVRTLARQLRGTLSVTRDAGTQVCVSFPTIGPEQESAA